MSDTKVFLLSLFLSGSVQGFSATYLDADGNEDGSDYISQGVDFILDTPPNSKAVPVNKFSAYIGSGDRVDTLSTGLMTFVTLGQVPPGDKNFSFKLKLLNLQGEWPHTTRTSMRVILKGDLGGAEIYSNYGIREKLFSLFSNPDVEIHIKPASLENGFFSDSQGISTTLDSKNIYISYKSNPGHSIRLNDYMRGTEYTVEPKVGNAVYHPKLKSSGDSHIN